MYKKHIKSNLNKTFPTGIECSDFKIMHECLEAYIKEILLLGLRKNNCQYKASRSFLKHSYMKLDAKTIDTATKLLLNDSWSDIKNRNVVLKELEDLVLNYSCKVRNILVHGNYYPNKQGEYELLYKIDKHFIVEFEMEIFNQLGNKVLDNTPKDFGILKGTIKDESSISTMLKVRRQSWPDFALMKMKFNVYFP